MWILVFVTLLQLAFTQPPHIVFILADDLGWNDVSFHGSDQIPTPNIDALAYNGVILNSHYSLPLCTPSRAALLTGKYPIHNGMQHNIILEPEPWGLPLEEYLLPQYLSPLGYTSHAVGKWHLGFYKKEFTPTERGFASHYGFWNGYQDYYSHIVQASFVPYEGYDMRRNLEIAYDAIGHYSTDLFTKEAVRLIQQHDASNSSLFLYLSHLAPHAGNYENPLQAPADTIKKFKCIKDKKRRLYAAMVSEQDESVGSVMQALEQKGILNNTIVVFISDNGAATHGVHPNSGSNWPLRGEKGTPWEGSSRTVALVWSSSLQKRRRISNQLMHITDWLPTLYSAAGGDVSQLRNIDGFNLWDAISQDLASPRSDVLINIDTRSGYSAVRLGRYKYVNGTTLLGSLDRWSTKPGQDDKCSKYQIRDVLNSKSARAISSVIKLASKKEMERLRQNATISCTLQPLSPSSCKPMEQSCVFDIQLDPCEITNLFETRGYIVKILEAKMATYMKTMVEPINKSTDKLANPKYWNNTWTHWRDFPAPTQVGSDHIIFGLTI